MSWLGFLGGYAFGQGVAKIGENARIKEALDPKWYRPVTPPLPVELWAQSEGVCNVGVPSGWRHMTSDEVRRLSGEVRGRVALGVCMTEPDPRLGCSATSFSLVGMGPDSAPPDAQLMFVNIDEVVSARVQGIPDFASYGGPSRIGLDGERAFVHHMIGSVPGASFGVEFRVPMMSADVVVLHAATMYVGMFNSPTETYESFLPHLWTMLGNWHWLPRNAPPMTPVHHTAPEVQPGPPATPGTVIEPPSRPPTVALAKTVGDRRPWLAVGMDDDGAVYGAERILAVGLEPGDRSMLVAAALCDDPPAAPLLISERAELPSLEEHSVLHLDMTGTCQAHHRHVTWEPADLPIDVLTHVAGDLALAVADPDWSPAPGAGATIADAHQLLSPDYVTIVPVLSAALWAAGHSGVGSRGALDWLASDELPRIVSLCRSNAGDGPVMLLDMLDDLLCGPAPKRQAAVISARDALAPIAEVQRMAEEVHDVQRLDVKGWQSSNNVLAVTLPPSPSTGQEQMIAAILNAMLRDHDPRSAPGSPAPWMERCAWLDVAKPRHWDWHVSDVYASKRPRAAVIVDQPSRFDAWAASGKRHDVLLGARVDPSLVARAGTMAGVTVQPPAPGRLALILDGHVREFRSLC